jgi:hypothetical protein
MLQTYFLNLFMLITELRAPSQSSAYAEYLRREPEEALRFATRFLFCYSFFNGVEYFYQPHTV